MTRLTSMDIADVAPHLADYDAELRAKTGLDLLQLACRAAGLEPGRAQELIPKYPVGVLPMTCGPGGHPRLQPRLGQDRGLFGFTPSCWRIWVTRLGWPIWCGAGPALSSRRMMTAIWP
jgi:hypothetical protein